jgi:hypothetical protein
MGWVWGFRPGCDRRLIDGQNPLDGKLDLLAVTVEQLYGGKSEQDLVSSVFKSIQIRWTSSHNVPV